MRGCIKSVEVSPNFWFWSKHSFVFCWLKTRKKEDASLEGVTGNEIGKFCEIQWGNMDLLIVRSWTRDGGSLWKQIQWTLSPLGWVNIIVRLHSILQFGNQEYIILITNILKHTFLFLVLNLHETNYFVQNHLFCGWIFLAFLEFNKETI